ncbi:LysR family transcriptional regulator [Rhodopseudomonas telluris]|uniref:LysR family transcriptional regulator n=1 Tax=Rhodopseudomonas telluris TaxID=644215 RepID=A0ABV6EXB3_9BRAD
MAQVPKTTIEQWSILRAVVELGSYAQAAETLHRSQSSISYAIANLQQAANVQLLQIEGRRAVLTEAGRALLAEVGPLIDDFLRIEQRACAVGHGERVALRLLVDSVFPKPRLFNALQSLSRAHPHVDVHLREAVRLPMPEPNDRTYDIAIAQPTIGSRYGTRVADVDLIAVASKTHPLAHRSRPISRATLARHLGIEIRDIEWPASLKTQAGGKTWHMSTIESVIGVVREGLGYSWLPRHMIQGDLSCGDLVELCLGEGGERRIPLDLCFSEQEPANGAVLFLAEALGPS